MNSSRNCKNINALKVSIPQLPVSPIPTSVDVADTPRTPTVADRFLINHTLSPAFTARYTIQDEIGSGGYGFVCSAIRKSDAVEVAVKFIIRENIPHQGWARDSVLGIIPLECYFIKKIRHPNIIGFLDYFEVQRVSYLVTQLHGSPWNTENDPHSITTLSPPTTPHSEFSFNRRKSTDLFEYN
jgi:serine/threonine protein kinase